MLSLFRFKLLTATFLILFLTTARTKIISEPSSTVAVFLGVRTQVVTILAKEMNDSYKAGEASGLIKEEVAFYDALTSHETAEQALVDESNQREYEHRLDFARFRESQDEDHSSKAAEEVRLST